MGASPFGDRRPQVSAVFCEQRWSRTRDMTPDGIATEDWDRVHELALEVVNASAEGEEAASEAATLRLRELLDELQQKYGPLPSLLATRADYISDGPQERDYWLAAAYEQAEKLGDTRNLVWIAASLATLHVDDLGDAVQGSRWLTQLEEHLRATPDESEAEEAGRLRGILESLKGLPQNNDMQRTRATHPKEARGPRR